MVKLKKDHPAVIEGRTIHQKTRKDPTTAKNILQCVSGNSKMSKGKKFITKGKWKGMRIFNLTLEERATCPRTCIHWMDCYGNNTFRAVRVEHGPEMELALSFELAKLARKYPEGFVVRLHVLGDFYSKRYVNFWRRMLKMIPNLYLFGYTARSWQSIANMNHEFKGRCYIRQSTNDLVNTKFHITSGNNLETGIHCPEMSGKTESCLTCGLCWTDVSRIIFPDH